MLAARLSDVLFKLVLMALAFAAAPLLLRDAFAIGAHVPLDPQEGWHAYLAQAAVTGHPLYPQGLMINNYPPLSFYIVGALSNITRDAIVTGRLVSLIAFFALAGGIIVCLREMGASVLASLFGALFFAAGLLIAGNEVAINDPRLLGHALQLAGLSLLLPTRRDVLFAALLMAAGLFVQHTLLALPLASLIWLWGRDRAEAARFSIALLILCLAGLALTRFFLGPNLLTLLNASRPWALANFIISAAHFSSWAGVAIIAAALITWMKPKDEMVRLVALYTGASLIVGGIFSFSDGVDSSIFCDAAIALGLGAGLVLLHLPLRWTGAAALALTAPLALFPAHAPERKNSPYSEVLARAVPLDIAFLRIHPGPALCQNLALCYMAGKEEPVDVVNLAEAIRTRSRSDAELIGLINARHFGAVQIDSLDPFVLGAKVKAALLAHYRVSRDDNEGVFLEPRPVEN